MRNLSVCFIAAALFAFGESSIRAAELPDVSFSADSWKLSGSTLAGGVLTMDGVSSPTPRSSLTIPAAPFGGKKFFFLCEVQLSKPQDPESAEPPMPAFFNDKNIQITSRRIEVPASRLGAWKTFAMLCEPNRKGQTAQLRFEFVLKEGAGSMDLRNAQRTLEQPPIPADVTDGDLSPFKLPASAECTLKIDTSNKKPFDPEVLGINRINTAVSENKKQAGEKVLEMITASDPQVQELLKRCAPLPVRFPARTMANWYNWETDSYAIPDWDALGQSYKTTYGFIREGEKKQEKFDFAGYAKSCAEHAIAPVLVTNVLCDSPENCAAQLRDRIAKGALFEALRTGDVEKCIELSDPAVVKEKGRDAAEKYFEGVSSLIRFARIKPEDRSIKSIVPDDSGHSARVAIDFSVNGRPQKPAVEVWSLIDGRRSFRETTR